MYVVAAFSVIAWMAFDLRLSEAETVHFSAQELENQRASWAPQDVVIRHHGDSEGEIRFVLDNPTDRTHVFEAPGVFEQTVADNLARTTRPLRITVAPKETTEILVRFAQTEGDPEPPCVEGATCYRFYCPLHRGDTDPGGTIRVIY